MVRLAFRNVVVFDGEQFLDEPRSVVVDGQTIVSVSTEEADADGVIDGRGRALLPGVIDAHVHLGFFDPRTVLSGGVTTARDLGWPLPRVRELAVAQGPDVLFAGPILTAPGGYPSRATWAPRGTAREIGSAEQAREAVSAIAAAGACVVKVAQEPRAGAVLNSVTLAAIVDAAHGRSLRVTSHCGRLRELLRALECGVDELAHGLWSDEPIPDDVLDEMVARDVAVVPTLHIEPSGVRISNVRRFAERGGAIMYGTDMGNDPVPPGIDVEELHLLRRAGMSTEAALRSATAAAADRLGLGDRGRVAPDMRADLVLLEGDPRADLSVLRRPALVVHGGAIVG